jgi:predicted GNAT family acetyltransferase
VNEVRDNPQAGRYEIRVDGELAGFVVYTVRGGRFLLVHTEIFDVFAGHGYGGALIRGALDDLRVRGECVVPICPFVDAFIRKHPEYDDLVDHAVFDPLNVDRTK